MARRFDAAETLVEQPKALPAAGTRVRSAVQVSPGHPGTPAGSAPPHHLGLGEHLTSAIGRAPSRTATQRAAVAVAVCNAVLRRPSDPEVVGCAYRRIFRRASDQ